MKSRVVCAFCLLVCVIAAPANAEMVEEIVAWVNGDIIILSDIEEEEQLLVADAYRRYTGEELDKQVKAIRESLLINLIDRKVLLHRAQLLYDTAKMGEVFLDGFKEQQGITSDEQFQQMLDRESMSIEELQEKLIEMFAPDEVIRFEVRSRISVGDREVEAYYTEHPEDFQVRGRVDLREIVLLADSEAKREARWPEVEAIQKRLADGEDFATLATEVSEAGTKETGGEMNHLARGDLSAQLEAMAFTVPVGAVSEPMETAYGYHIIKVETRTDDRALPLEEIRDQLRSTLEARKYNEDFAEFITTARGEAEWCVKPKFRSRLSIQSPECEGI
jgi:parvulin-like peptidyl-prolyl isomerase